MPKPRKRKIEIIDNLFIKKLNLLNNRLEKKKKRHKIGKIINVKPREKTEKRKEE